MSEYLSVIIVVSLFTAIINVFLGERGVSKNARTITSVVMLACVIIPIIKTIVLFRDNLAIPVINENSQHMIDKEDDKVVYRQWLAKTTADEISKEIAASVKKYTGIEVEVECPWHLEGESIIFDVLRVYTKCDQRYYNKIKNTIKLYYQLDSECIKI